MLWSDELIHTLMTLILRLNALIQLRQTESFNCWRHVSQSQVATCWAEPHEAETMTLQLLLLWGWRNRTCCSKWGLTLMKNNEKITAMASLTRDPTRPGQIRGWTRSVSISGFWPKNWFSIQVHCLPNFAEKTRPAHQRTYTIYLHKQMMTITRISRISNRSTKPTMIPITAPASTKAHMFISVKIKCRQSRTYDIFENILL